MSIPRPRALQALSIVLLVALALVCVGEIAHAGMPGGAGAGECGVDARCGDQTLCGAATPSTTAPTTVAILSAMPGLAAPAITTVPAVTPSPPAPALRPLLAVAARSPPLT